MIPFSRLFADCSAAAIVSFPFTSADCFPWCIVYHRTWRRRSVYAQTERGARTECIQRRWRGYKKGYSGQRHVTVTSEVHVTEEVGRHPNDTRYELYLGHHNSFLPCDEEGLVSHNIRTKGDTFHTRTTAALLVQPGWFCRHIGPGELARWSLQPDKWWPVPGVVARPSHLPRHPEGAYHRKSRAHWLYFTFTHEFIYSKIRTCLGSPRV